MQEKQRQSNIELLRIVAIVMSVVHHFAVHGNMEFPLTSLSANRLWIQLLMLGGKVGVNLFVLSSG